MRLLIVKTSSMGDVVHALPVVSDVLRKHPKAAIDWLVEAPFAAIPQLHPGVRKVLPIAWRKWRSKLLERNTWKAIGEARAMLKRERYDVVLDLQGLVKSAIWARQANAPVVGYDRASIREPLAAMLYQHTAAVPRELHAVDRCRQLAAAHQISAPPSGPPDFGLRVPRGDWLPRSTYAVLIPNASRREKLWPERHWVSVGRKLKEERGWTPLVLWGRPEEQSLAESIAAGCEGDVPPFLRVDQMAGVLANAQQVVGLDTGFTHLAAAFGRPTVGIYCDHEPGLAGIIGPGLVASIGGKKQVPSRNDVLALVEDQWSA
jgi:heptosyltransferase-1